MIMSTNGGGREGDHLQREMISGAAAHPRIQLLLQYVYDP
jgi:hypothetical protein